MRQNPNFENLDIIESYLDPDGDPTDPEYFLHFTKITKVGLNPQQAKKYSTPIGIYAYPLIPYTWQQLIDNRIPFAGGSAYVAVLKPTRKYPMAVLDEDDGVVRVGGAVIDKDGAEKFMSELKAATNKVLPESKAFDAWLNSTWSVPRQWFYGTRVAAALEVPGVVEMDRYRLDTPAVTSAWSKYLRDMKIAGVYDPVHGIIHPNEPSQAFFLRTSDTSIKAFLDNPWRTGGNGRDKRQHEATRWRARKGLKRIPSTIEGFDLSGPLAEGRNALQTAHWATLKQLVFQRGLAADKCVIERCVLGGSMSIRDSNIIDCHFATRPAASQEGQISTVSVAFDNCEVAGCLFPVHAVVHVKKTEFRDCCFEGVVFDGGLPSSVSFENCRFRDCGVKTQWGELILISDAHLPEGVHLVDKKEVEYFRSWLPKVPSTWAEK